MNFSTGSVMACSSACRFSNSSSGDGGANMATYRHVSQV